MRYFSKHLWKQYSMGKGRKCNLNRWHMIMIKMTKTQSNKKGFVLPLVIVIVIFLFVIGSGLLRLGSSARMQAVQGVADISARAAADAGLVSAVFQMNKKLNLESVWNNEDLPSATSTSLPTEVVVSTRNLP